MISTRMVVLLVVATFVTAAIILFRIGEGWYGLGAAGIGLWILTTAWCVLLPTSRHRDEDSDNVAGVYARQADELAAIVETLMRNECAQHTRTMRTLQVLAVSLGEQHRELDALAARLAGGDPR